MHTQILILGSGPAGYTAAIYAALAGFQTTLVMGILPGGQLILSHEIENFPGYISVSGMDLSDTFQAQAKRAGVQLIFENVTFVDLKSHPFRCETGLGHKLSADALIIATGSTARWLQLPGESALIGHGISICATCDGFFHKGKAVAVIGGGNTAVYEALFLTQTCSKVYLIYREKQLSADQNLLRKLYRNKKICLLRESRVLSFLGEDRLSGLIWEHIPTGKQQELDLSGAFEAVGQIPNSHIFNGQLDIDSDGYIQTKPLTLETSVPGVFACGDIQSPEYRQAIIAAGDGCRAALSAKKYLLSKTKK